MHCRFRDWRQLAADAIYQNISKYEGRGDIDTLNEIRKMCRNTVEDLKAILSKLEEFQTKLLLADKKNGKIFYLILLKFERLSDLKFL